jgi:alkanesulfonate monooxygenase SsuD/methylene tetrahydromethanopterin reductase-like flavin-dependent oxidoreductase (luciferase family)
MLDLVRAAEDIGVDTVVYPDHVAAPAPLG